MFSELYVIDHVFTSLFKEASPRQREL